MKRFLVTGVAFLSLALSSIDAREVFVWVSSDALSDASKALNLNCGAYSPKDAITHLALQAWLVNSDGTIELDTEHGASKTGAQNTKRTCDSLKIHAIMCVYNLINSQWNWATALSGFKTNRSKLVKSIMDEVTAYGFDGVNLDFEGPSASATADLPAYTEFLKELSAQLKPQGKYLSVACYCSPCYNAPNTSWWKNWKGIVNSQHIMGYEQTWEANENSIGDECPSDPSQANKKTFKYSYMVTYGLSIGLDTSEVGIGLQVMESWGSQNAGYHIQTILDLPAVPSVCIWELGYISRSTIWKTSALWEKLAKIKKIGSNTTTTVNQSNPAGFGSRNICYKILQNSITVPERFRSAGHYAEIYSFQGKLIDRIQLSANKRIFLTSASLNLVKFQ
jgi:hypothetical protein